MEYFYYPRRYKEKVYQGGTVVAKGFYPGLARPAKTWDSLMGATLAEGTDDGQAEKAALNHAKRYGGIVTYLEPSGQEVPINKLTERSIKWNTRQ